jgi:hypothetical protein
MTAALAPSATYLGPATVLAPAQTLGRVEVLLATGEQKSAVLAIATPYRPATGDEVLVIGNAIDALYVVGVIRGSGITTLSVPGDLAIQAPNGSITVSASKQLALTSEQSVKAAAPRVMLCSARLDLWSKRILQKSENAYLWVSELFQLKSRRVRTLSEEGYFVKARRMHLKSSENCKIDARTIHLG